MTPDANAALDVKVMDEGGYVVRGTTDEAEAREAVRRFVKADEYVDGLADADTVPLLRSGLFRWNPCNERSCYDGGGHFGHIGYADKRGPGVFEGVYFQW